MKSHVLAAGDKLIGKGGMGEVYKARDTRLNLVVAINFCNQQFSGRFERDARAVAALIGQINELLWCDPQQLGTG
jgi:serine/threonine protein kinase